MLASVEGAGSGDSMDAGRGGLDPVTGLPTRAQFFADCVAPSDSGKAIALVSLVDARAFGDLLRALGHARSEAFIRAGAERLRDILGPDAKIYHASLLSFVFITDARPAERPEVVDRVAAGFATPLQCDDIPIEPRVGLGFAPLTAKVAPRPEDLRAALAASQDSRNRGEGWAWYDSRSDAAHLRSFSLLTALKAALAEPDQLYLAYQPKVALKTGDAPSAEALLRWTHPEFGPVSPGEFVPLAETTALLKPLTRRVVTGAVAQLVSAHRAGLDLTLAINVSPRNLEESDFIEFLIYACADAGVDRSRLEIEVTEGLNAAQGTLILERLATLSRLGFPIAIDDFGSGYSNMSYLSRLSAQTLKIDQSLVRGVEAETQAGRLLAGVVNMGRDLGYKIVAEGVESEAERALLTSWGCDFGQGYLFARPMDGPDLLDWLDRRRPPVKRSA